MAFEGLADKLGNAFKKLKSKGKLTESDVDVYKRQICTDIDFHVNFPNRNKFVKNKFIYQVKLYHIHK